MYLVPVSQSFAHSSDSNTSVGQTVTSVEAGYDNAGTKNLTEDAGAACNYLGHPRADAVSHRSHPMHARQNAIDHLSHQQTRR